MSLTTFDQAQWNLAFSQLVQELQACFTLHPKHITRDFFKHKTVKVNDKIQHFRVVMTPLPRKKYISKFPLSDILFP